MWVLESVTIATDQIVAHHADPASTVASAPGAWLFGVVAVIGVMPVIGVVPVIAFHRRLRSNITR